MAETITDTKLPDLQFEELPRNQNNLPATQPGVGYTQVSTKVFTARRVEMKRDISVVREQVAQYAAAFGDHYLYSWRTSNSDNTKGTVQGLTIQGAMQLLSLYGNAVVDNEVSETDTHYLFNVQFADLETGANFNRLYKQRKGQAADFGKMGKDRAEDIVFQIGQSKAIRNAIVNGIPALARYMEEQSGGAVVQRVKKDPDGARKWVDNELAKMKLDVRRAEKYLGREKDKWIASDLAALITAINSIGNGMTHIDEVFPSIEVSMTSGDKAEAQQQGDGQKQADGDKARTRQSKNAPKDDKAKANAPAAERGKSDEGEQQNSTAPSAEAQAQPKQDAKPAEESKPKQAPTQQKAPPAQQQQEEPPTPSDDDLDDVGGEDGDGWFGGSDN